VKKGQIQMRQPVKVLIGVVGIAAFSFSTGSAVTGAHAAAGSALPFTVPVGPVAPNASNNLDCNGWQTGSSPAVPFMKARCTDPVQPPGNQYYTGLCAQATNGCTSTYTRFYDNGHYVGHDEPSVKFISSVAGSGNNMTYFQQLSKDPNPTLTRTTQPSCGAPNAPDGATNGGGAAFSCLNTNSSVSDYAELSVAPWFGLGICDHNSFPALPNQDAPCTPDSDANNASTAGSAFMELQFYPPGYGPWLDSTSMDQTRWVAALNIDSLECVNPTLPLNLITGCQTNPHCTEPVNFGILTLDGAPTGPPNPQSPTLQTFTPNSDTLLMNPGDTLKVQIFEYPGTGPDTNGLDTSGLETKVTDLTTGQVGFMISSAHNGFMDTNPGDCTGSNFSFHAEYSTARQQNQTPWAALEGGVLMEDEIGHAEVCGALMNSDPSTSTYTRVENGVDVPQGFTDTGVMDNCNDPVSDPSADSPLNGECATGVNSGCQPQTFEDTATAPYPYGGQTGAGTGLLEVADGYCQPKGAHSDTETDGPSTITQNWVEAVGYCNTGRYQNGDLDYDGTSYQTDWPDGLVTHPQTFRYIGPFDSNGNSYQITQLETDAAGSEGDCTVASGAGCTVPPYGALFYPFWSISTRGLDGITVAGHSSYCVWNFGNDGNPQEVDNLGGDFPNASNGGNPNGQYGSPNASRFGGTVITGQFSNPQVNGRSASQIGTTKGPAYSCPAVTLSQVGQPGTGVPEAPWMPGVLLGGVVALGATLGVRRARRSSAQLSG